MPLFALPVQLMPTLPFLVSSFVVVPVGMLPLAADFCDRLDDRRAGRTSPPGGRGSGVGVGPGGRDFRGGRGLRLAFDLERGARGCVAFVPGCLPRGPPF